MNLSEKWFRCTFKMKAATVVRYTKGMTPQMAEMRVKQLYPGCQYKTVKAERCWNTMRFHTVEARVNGFVTTEHIVALNPEHAEIMFREDYYPGKDVIGLKVWVKEKGSPKKV